MRKQAGLIALMLVCALLLCGCQGDQERFPLAGGAPQTSTQSPVSAVSEDVVLEENADAYDTYDYDSGSYDPSSEESWGDVEDVLDTITQARSADPTMAVITSEYAGATPVVIDPIDKPTATPAPAIAFSEYQTYDATKLRLSFQGPVGWDADDTLADTYTLTNPDRTAAFQARVIITARAVSNEYTENDLKKEVKSIINGYKADYENISATNTASRTLFDKKAIYADFTGTPNGTEVKVWGRVHAVTVNKTLVVVRILAPNEYSRTYKDSVYSKIRHTIQFIK